MISRHDNSTWNTLPLFVRVIILLVLCGGALIFFMRGKEFILGVSSLPLRLAQSVPPFASLGEWFSSKGSLLAEKEQLSAELRIARDALSVQAVLIKENTTLRALLSRKDNADALLYAPVISAPPVSPYDSLIVDIGGSSQVHVGDLALSGAHTVAGTVSNVYGRQAKVDLFSTYGMQIDAEAGDGETTLVVTGRGGGNWSATVPKDASVALGDLVLVPQYGFRVLGTIGSIEKSKDSALSEVIIQSPENLYTIPALSIVQK